MTGVVEPDAFTESQFVAATALTLLIAELLLPTVTVDEPGSVPPNV